MRILVVGSGGREHAIVWKLGQSPIVKELLWAPGNGGAAPPVECVDVKAEDIQGLVSLARERNTDLVFVGPEVPLAMGIADELEREGIACFGPSAAAARIEASKVFCKEFCVKHGIPTAPFTVWESYSEAKTYIETMDASFPVVLKADGLAAGKGVLICSDRQEALDGAKQIMEDQAFGSAGERMLVESFLRGEEASLMVFSDGEKAIPMPPARDYKRAMDGDEGLNTGGMGAYCPSSRMSAEQTEEAMDKIIRPAVKAFQKDGTPYRGVLYAGLMLTNEGPQLLEFNCRFGDPETQVILPMLDVDLAETAMSCAKGALPEAPLRLNNGAAVTVVLCSGGYPLSYEKGKTIEGLNDVAGMDNTVVFHAGTKESDGNILTSGGRVLNVTGRGATVEEARKTAYTAANKIYFEKLTLRSDIAGGV